MEEGTSVAESAPERLPRLTASQLKQRFAKKEAGVVRFTLAEILFGSEAVQSAEDGATVVLKPLNFKGLSGLETEYGDLSKVPSPTSLKGSPRELCRLLTIFVNQDLDGPDEKTQDQVAQSIDGENIGQLVAALESVIRPIHASATGRAGADPTGQG